MAGSWLDGGSSGKAVDVHEVIDPSLLSGLLDIVQAGALLSIGTTTDGGAMHVTVTINGEWRREYVRTLDEMRNWMAEAVPGVLDILAAGRPTAATRSKRTASRSR